MRIMTLTMMVPYYEQDPQAPLAAAFYMNDMYLAGMSLVFLLI